MLFELKSALRQRASNICANHTYTRNIGCYSETFLSPLLQNTIPALWEKGIELPKKNISGITLQLKGSQRALPQDANSVSNPT